MDNINRDIQKYIEELKSRVDKLDNIHEIKQLIANITTKIPITIYPKLDFICIYFIIIIFYIK